LGNGVRIDERDTTPRKLIFIILRCLVLSCFHIYGIFQARYLIAHLLQKHNCGTVFSFITTLCGHYKAQ
jgi:hypothetical protein